MPSYSGNLALDDGLWSYMSKFRAQMGGNVKLWRMHKTPQCGRPKFLPS